MTPAATRLAALQRDFARWLTEESDAAATRLGGGDGLLVYQNNYRVALMSSLEASFPRAHAWLGDEGFAAAAARYIDEVPPRSWTLDAYGERFAAALAELWPEDPEIGDLAAIDWAVGQAFVAADAAPFDAGGLGDVDWDHARIVPVPSLVTFTITSNADAIWLALAGGDDPVAAEVLAAPRSVIVWRQGFEAVMRALDDTEAQLLALAARGASFAASCETLAQSLGEAAAVEAAGTILGRWIAEGLVARIAG